MNTPATHAVRGATIDDLDALASLRYAFRAEHHELIEQESVFLTRCTEWMRLRLSPTSHWRVWVIEQSRALVGNVWVQMVEKIPNPGHESELHAYLSNFYVQREVRNTGGGSALLTTALAECRSLQVDSVFLWPTARSRALYARHGFRPSGDLLVNKF